MDIGSYIADLPDVLSRTIEVGLPWLQQYGLFAVGVGLMTETLFFTGVWVPGYGILVAAGYLVAAGQMSGWAVVVVAALGGFVGDTLSYLVGLRYGTRVLGRFEAQAERIRTALEVEGPFLLICYHFMPILRALVPCVAGSARYDLRRWFTIDPVGLVAWVITTLAIGYCAHGALHARGNLIALSLNAAATILVVVITVRVHRSYSRLARGGDEDRGTTGRARPQDKANRHDRSMGDPR